MDLIGALQASSGHRRAVLARRVPSGGGGGKRTSGDSPDSDDFLKVSPTSIPADTVKQCEQNVLADVLTTRSQIPDVNRELAEMGALYAIFAAVRRERGEG